MARKKGVKMTEEQKAAMRAKRLANKLGKESAFNQVTSNLRHLSFSELNNIIALALRYRKERIGEEELRLIKEKEELELQLKKLKEADTKVNL
ncbi:hypothetical protein LJC57_09970 [Parabacteroides sp. OttesenSCG-928-G07]|nr:hypothetical protein [Parabacteroides sp. OttesenSCG-928-G21]MDL2278904.1 hypothetical protein [Parabacteroides sp. OttesenSCG-928-G07]